MAKLIALDSFDHYTSAQSSMKWRDAITLTDNGRTGKGAIGGNSSIPVKLFDLEQTVCAGIAYKTNSLANYPIGFGNNRTVTLAAMYVTGDGRVYAYLDGQTSPSSPVRLSPNEWYYLEFKCTHHVYPPPPSGSSDIDFECYVNGELVLEGTVEAGYAFKTETGFAYCILRGPGGGETCIFDDFYVTDGERLGDVRIYVIRPDGDFTPSQWIPINGGAHYVEVDDINPDQDTSYLYSPNVNEVDMVTLEDIAVTGDIMGIQLNHVAQKDDAGDAAFRAELNVSSSNYEIDDDRYTSFGSWTDFTSALRKNPITLNDFTVSEINDMKMGAKRTA